MDGPDGSKRRWRAARTYLVRAPALPVERFLDLGRWKLGQSPDPVAALLADPAVALALAVASPSIAAALAARAPGSDLGRLARPVLSYLIRASTRPTPFGLFAGVASGAWADRTRLDLAGPPTIQRARPDMAWLAAVVERLERDPVVRSRLRLVTHPAVRFRGGRAVLPAAARAGRGPGNSVDGAAGDVSVRATPVVREVLELCKPGLGYEAIVHTLLTTKPDRGPVRVHQTLDALLGQGLLATDLRPPLTGSPAGYVVERLRVAGANPAADTLAALLAAMADWSDLPAAAALDAWPRLVDAAWAIEPHPPLIQVDAGFRGTVALPRSVATEACRAVDLLYRLSPRPDRYPGLAAWRSKFEATFGAGRAVALPEILDAGLPDLHGKPPSNARHTRLLLRLAGDAMRRGRRVVELDDELLAEFAGAVGQTGRPPRSVDVCVAVAAESAAAIDAGQFLLVVTNNGVTPTAGRTLGRFAHVLGDGVLGQADEEAGYSAITAELLFEPLRPRSANVMVRPLPTGRTIAVTGVSPPGAIPLDELAVTLRHGRLGLRWPRGGTDVVASCQHMLNLALAPPLAHFLYAVSHDDEAPIPDRFDWGPAGHLPFRPRVQAGRVVLRRAAWSLDRQTLDALARGGQDARRAAGIPRHVLLGPVDQQLLVDLDSDAGSLLLQAARRRGAGRVEVDVEEALPGPEHACARGGDGRRLVELVVPVIQGPPPAAIGPRADPAAISVSRAERLRPPGSDWLYAKLYLPPNLAEDVAAGPVRALAKDLLAAGAADAWFFVRYADPAFHLRLRFAGDPDMLRRVALPRVTDWAASLLAAGVIDRFSFDTYEREVERYGGPAALALVERLFAADSVAVAELLAARRRIEASIGPLQLAAWTVDNLLDALGLDPAERVRWYRDQRRHSHQPGRDGRPAEFGRDKARLRALLAGATRDAAAELVRAILADRRTVVEGVASGLRALAGAGALGTPYHRLARSIVHMHCNRLCAGGPDVEERVLAVAGLTRASLLAWPDVSDSGLFGPAGDA